MRFLFSLHASGAGPSDVPAAEPDQEQEEADAEALGLDLDADKASKKRRLSGPRVKRSREEVFEEEREKLRAKLDEILSSLADPSVGMPTTAACSKHMRAINNKLDEARAAGMFDCVTSLEELLRNFTLLKEAVRVANAYITPSGSVKKAYEAFVTGMKNLPKNVRGKFPAMVLERYHHILVHKDTCNRVRALYPHVPRGFPLSPDSVESLGFDFKSAGIFPSILQLGQTSIDSLMF